MQYSFYQFLLLCLELITLETSIWFDMVAAVSDISSCISTTLWFLDSVELIGVTVYGAWVGPLLGEASAVKECGFDSRSSSFVHIMPETRSNLDISPCTLDLKIRQWVITFEFFISFFCRSKKKRDLFFPLKWNFPWILYGFQNGWIHRCVMLYRFVLLFLFSFVCASWPFPIYGHF